MKFFASMIPFFIAVFFSLLFFLLSVGIKKKWFFSILPSLVVFFLILQLQGIHLRFRFFKVRQPHLVVLADWSQSMDTNRVLDLVSSLPKQSELFYFSDEISKKAEEIDPHHTRIGDVLRKIGQKMLPGDVLCMISDFQDTGISSLKADMPIHAVLLEKSSNDSLGIEFVDLSEMIPKGERVEGSIRIRSAFPQRMHFQIVSDGKILFQKNFDLKKGRQDLKFKIRLLQKGKRLLKFQIKSNQDHDLTNNEEKYLVRVEDPRLKIFLLAGRPSYELKKMNLFLHSLEWLKVETKLLKRPDETFDLRRIRGDLIFLMDVSRKQLRNAEFLRNSKIPVLYQPGLQKEVLFSDRWQALDSPKKGFLNQNGVELPVIRVAEEHEKKVGKVLFVFLWNTAFWDLIQAPFGIKSEDYEFFWKGVLSRLLPRQNRWYKKLNSVDFAEEGQNLLKNSAESALLCGNRDLAESLDPQYLADPKKIPWKEWIPKRQKSIKEAVFFDKNLLFYPFLYIFFAFLLLLNWIAEKLYP